MWASISETQLFLPTCWLPGPSNQYFMLFFFFLGTKKLLCFLFYWHFPQHKWTLCPHGVRCSFRNAKGKPWLSLGEQHGTWQLVVPGATDHCHSKQFPLQSAAAPDPYWGHASIPVHFPIPASRGCSLSTEAKSLLKVRKEQTTNLSSPSLPPAEYLIVMTGF